MQIMKRAAWAPDYGDVVVFMRRDDRGVDQCRQRAYRLWSPQPSERLPIA